LSWNWRFNWNWRTLNDRRSYIRRRFIRNLIFLILLFLIWFTRTLSNSLKINCLIFYDYWTLLGGNNLFWFNFVLFLFSWFSFLFNNYWSITFMIVSLLSHT
jgi:hypothetical protein